MRIKDLEDLGKQITGLGFPQRIAEEAEYYMEANTPSFHLYFQKETGEEQLMYDLHVAKKNERYQLTGYELTLKEALIPDLKIDSISTKDLDLKLKEVDGWYDKFLDPEAVPHLSKQQYEEAVSFISAANNELYRLAEYKEGEEAAKLLMYKYHPQSG